MEDFNRDALTLQHLQVQGEPAIGGGAGFTLARSDSSDAAVRARRSSVAAAGNGKARGTNVGA